jgi:hypothetical protein
MRIRIWLTKTSVAYPHHLDADADPDSACHFHADPDSDPDPTRHFDSDPDPSFRIFWLVICKLMRMRIRIQLIKLMRNRIQLVTKRCGSCLSTRCGSLRIRIHNIDQNDADPDPQHCLAVRDKTGKLKLFLGFFWLGHCTHGTTD